MKYLKYLLLIIICFITSTVYASELIDVTLSKCVDGDTAYFYLNGESTKFRFLAIDTPESTNTIEEYGIDASEYTCNKLTNASSIQIEYDDTNRIDKYGRSLAWIYVDGTMLQKELISEGLAEVAYIYGDYKYTKELCRLEEEAYNNKKNIWTIYSWNKTYCSSIDYNEEQIKEEISVEEILLIIVIILALIIGFIRVMMELKKNYEKK